MKDKFLIAAVAAIILAPYALLAQAPAGAPAGTTGKCKDGSFPSAPAKSGACRGHKGVDTWYAAAPAKSTAMTAAPAPKPAAAPAPTSAMKPASTPAPAAAMTAAPAAKPASAPASKPSASKAAKTAAPGGGPGLVWLNTSSNVYHCYGSQNYGTTKAGKYLSEADAKAAGAHAAHGQGCSAK